MGREGKQNCHRMHFRPWGEREWEGRGGKIATGCISGHGERGNGKGGEAKLPQDAFEGMGREGISFFDEDPSHLEKVSTFFNRTSEYVSN